MSKIFISCITPTFNRAHILPRTIESNINQTYPDWEMIIVDDGSDDNTEEVVKRYVSKDKRIRYFKNPGKGGNSARNYGIKQAKGEWIAFLDDDDESLPERFEKQLKAAQESNSNFISSWFYTSNYGRNDLKPFIIEPLYGVGDGLPSRWLIKKEILEQVGGFDEDQIAMQDNELSFRLARLVSYTIHREYVSIIYNTPNSLSRSIEKPLKGKLQLLQKHSKMMHRFEYASWCYSIARDYMSINNYDSAKNYYKEVLINDQFGYYSKAIKLDMMLMRLNLLDVDFFLKLTSKLRKMLGKYPQIVLHECYPKKSE